MTNFKVVFVGMNQLCTISIRVHYFYWGGSSVFGDKGDHFQVTFGTLQKSFQSLKYLTLQVS